MHVFYLLLILAFAAEGPQPKEALQSSSDAKRKQPSRKFQLNYGASIEGLPSDATVKVWFPIAQSNSHQTVRIKQKSVPGKFSSQQERRYGNLIGYFESSNDGTNSIDFNIEYDVTRAEAKAVKHNSEFDKERMNKYLVENRLVPTSGKPVELLSRKDLAGNSLTRGRELYEIVEAYMDYDKSKPGYGNGDVMWACSSKTGNCTDFHSLFISLARSQNIPAKFEIGFPIPSDQKSGKIGGYHCWAWFHTDELGWVPVDISEADKHPEMKNYYFGQLTADRIGFSIGRDIELAPKSNSGPLNYFVYPHVEVNGKPWPKEQIKLNFNFKNGETN